MQTNYTYHIDLNERGYFMAHVENSRGKTVFSVDYPQYSCSTCGLSANDCKCQESDLTQDSTLFDDGFMQHSRDIDGLRAYLVDLGIMQEGYRLIEN